MNFNETQIIQKAVSFVQSVRTMILLISKLLTIILCSYYIANSSAYNVSWKLVAYLLPTNWIMIINEKLSIIGTYLLIIPLSIILTSLLYNNSRIINAGAALFSVMGTLILLIKGLKEGTLTEYMDFRVVQVYHEATLEEKIASCRGEYLSYLTAMVDISFEKQKFIKDYLEVHIIEIIEYLKSLPIKDIKPYALKLFETANLQYAEQHSKLISPKGVGMKYIIGGVIAVAMTCLVIYGVVNFWKESPNALLEHATLSQKTAESMADLSSTILNGQKATSSSLLQAIPEAVSKGVQIAVQTIQENFQSLLTKTATVLMQKINENANVTAEILAKQDIQLTGLTENQNVILETLQKILNKLEHA